MKTLINKIFCLILPFCFFSLVFLYSGCQKNFSYEFFCFGSPVFIYGKETVKKDIIKRIENEFYTLESEFSVKNGTFTKALNSLAPNEKLAITETQKQILRKCKNAYDFTEKKFDPTIYPFVKLWGFSPNNDQVFTLPKAEKINELLQNKTVDLSSIIIDNENDFITKNNADTQIDFGGILKGYATDVAYQILKENNINSGYINVGGSSLKVLNVESFSIRHPLNTSKQILELNTKNMENFSVSTSGTYEKYHKIDGVTYSHIIDPRKGLPTQTGIVSATVIGLDGVLCDAVSTALCLCEFDKTNQSELVTFINKIIANYEGVSVYIVYHKDGEKIIITNEKESENFTLLDNQFDVYYV